MDYVAVVRTRLCNIAWITDLFVLVLVQYISAWYIQNDHESKDS